MARSGKVVSLVQRRVNSTEIIEENDSWHYIEEFMGYPIPQDLKKAYQGTVEFQPLDRFQIGEVIHEKPPFMNTYRAVLLTNGEKLRVLALSLITEKDCEGHFPGRVMIPLLQYCKSMTLAGEIIAAFATYGLEVVPIPSKTDGIKATSNQIIRPPAVILSEAELLGDKGAFCYTRNSTWYGDMQVATIKRIVYNLVPRRMVFRSS